MATRIHRVVWWAFSICMLVTWSCSAPQNGNSPAYVEMQSRAAFGWRGFKHAWTYNHRLSRIGNTITDFGCVHPGGGPLPEISCTSTLRHTAATGYGRDEARFTTHLTKVVTTDTGFQTGEVELKFEGGEEETLTRRRTVRLRASRLLRNRTRYMVLLGGYDLHVVGSGDAKKVQRFEVWVDDRPVYYPETETLEVQVGALLNANCDSLECFFQPNRVEYLLRLRFLVVAGDEGVRETTREFVTSYRWDRKREIAPNDVRLNRSRQTIRGEDGPFDDALLGFRRIGFDLYKNGKRKDHWFVGWHNTIEDVEYDRERAEATFDLNLFFKEWNAKTRSKFDSVTSHGKAALSADVVLVQLANARIERDGVSGSLLWPGHDQSPESGSAVWSRQLQMTY